MMRAQTESRRPYRSALRRRQAEETRRRVVEASLELFARRGYHATTFADIAAAADVSVQTVQKHGPKSALLQSAVELASFGVEGETDFFATEVGRSVLDVADADALAAAVGEAMLAINAPSAAVWMSFVGAAQGDAELREYHARFLLLIRGQVEGFLRFVEERGWLRDDVPFDALVEAACVILSVESYARFVLLDGRSPADYRAFVERTVRLSILAP